MVDGPLDVLRPVVVPVGHPACQLRHRRRLPAGEHRVASGSVASHRGRGRFGDGPLLAGRLPRDQRLTKPCHGGDDRLVAVAGDRMGGERHARADGVDHGLDQHRHRRAPATVPVVVGRDPLTGCGREASPHRVTQPGGRHVEVGLVQAGVRGIGQVLGRTR
jgi:hypothetical protein